METGSYAQSAGFLFRRKFLGIRPDFLRLRGSLLSQLATGIIAQLRRKSYDASFVPGKPGPKETAEPKTFFFRFCRFADMPCISFSYSKEAAVRGEKCPACSSPTGNAFGFGEKEIQCPSDDFSKGSNVSSGLF